MPKKVRIWYREPRSKWYGEYWDGGKRHAKAFDNHKEARRWKSWMLHRLNYEPWKGVAVVPWRDLISYYLDDKDANGISASAKIEVVNSLKRFEELIGAVQSGKLNTRHIQQFKKARAKRNMKTKKAKTVSARTINKDLANLRALVNWGVENHYIHGDAVKIVFLKERIKKFQPPPVDELAALFQYAETCPPLYLRMVLALATGLRRSAVERIALSKSEDYHIDLATGIVKTYESKNKEEVIKHLGDTAMAIVNKYVVEYSPEGSTKLFNEQWDGAIRNAWNRARVKAGLPKFTFHNLRNMSASYLADQGESGSVIQDHTGHKQLATTERYIGVHSKSRERVTQKLDGLLGTILSSCPSATS